MLSNKPSVSPFSNASNMKQGLPVFKDYFILMQYFLCTKQMKIILTTTLYLLFIIMVIPVVAQKRKSSTGYIITQANDTIACEFAPYNWKKQPVSLKVRIDGK